MPNHYRYGRKAEEKVARQLRGHGASVSLSPASRGPTDLVASFPAGTEWGVQVKSTRHGLPASPSPRELANLRRSATRAGRTAVLADVTPDGTEYRSARTGRRLNPPKRR